MRYVFLKNSLIKEKIKNIDSNYSHPSYVYECKMLNDIKMGHLTDAITDLDQINMLEKPTLAKGSIRSMKNSLIASCTLFTRAAIEAGIDSEDAFDLSDVFINHIESLTTDATLNSFEYEMLEDFVKLVQKNRAGNYPNPISKIIKYIYENATEKLSVKFLASTFNLSPDYLSRLFHATVGVHLCDYIQIQKVELAKSYLEFSELSITDISTLLEFCNPAYFTNVFKKNTGVSPNTYRKENGLHS